VSMSPFQLQFCYRICSLHTQFVRNVERQASSVPSVINPFKHYEFFTSTCRNVHAVCNQDLACLQVWGIRAVRPSGFEIVTQRVMRLE